MSLITTDPKSERLRTSCFAVNRLSLTLTKNSYFCTKPITSPPLLSVSPTPFLHLRPFIRTYFSFNPSLLFLLLWKKGNEEGQTVRPIKTKEGIKGEKRGAKYRDERFWTRPLGDGVEKHRKGLGIEVGGRVKWRKSTGSGETDPWVVTHGVSVGTDHVRLCGLRWVPDIILIGNDCPNWSEKSKENSVLLGDGTGTGRSLTPRRRSRCSVLFVLVRTVQGLYRHL